MSNLLGKIEKVNLREVWPHEALDFTKWLAKEKNLVLLSQAIGVELELVETESPVGPFHLDILAKETATGGNVVIENQLEETNHDHLGKIITYASGKSANIVVWIVASARDEHRKAIEWLNNCTDATMGFFLIEIELWSIDGSKPAPRFNVVESPNEWAKSVKEASTLSDTAKMQLEYWQTYKDIASGRPDFMKELRPTKPLPQHWSNLALGSSRYHMNLQVHIQKGRVAVELYIPDDKEIGQRVFENQALFEQKIGCPGVRFDAKKACGLRFFKDGCPIKGNQDRWSEYIDWQLDAALRLKEVVLELDL